MSNSPKQKTSESKCLTAKCVVTDQIKHDQLSPEHSHSLTETNQSEVAKAFLTLRDQEQRNIPENIPRPQVSESAYNTDWFLLWVVAWSGTTLAGGFFGLIFFLSAWFNNSPTNSGAEITYVFPMLFFGGIAAFLAGTIIAGIAGSALISTFAAVTWIVWWRTHPLLQVTLAGAITGIVCGAFSWLSFVMAPLGAVGAWTATKLFLVAHSGRSNQELNMEHTGEATRFSFSITDLMIRTTAIALLLCLWMSLLRGLNLLQ